MTTDERNALTKLARALKKLEFVPTDLESACNELERALWENAEPVGPPGEPQKEGSAWGGLPFPSTRS